MGDGAGIRLDEATGLTPEMASGTEPEISDPHIGDLTVKSSLPQVCASANLEKLPSVNRLFISAFYYSFWPCHPFLPSKRDIDDYLKSSEAESLIHAINHIGSLYARVGDSGLPSMAFLPNLHEFPQNCFAVQSLILLAISSHMSNNPAQAQAFLQTAIDIALAIGLHRNDFGAFNGKENHTITESWRRTWWELYILDTMFAGLNQTSNMCLKDVESDVLLPCEEVIYHNGEVCMRSSPHVGLLI